MISWSSGRKALQMKAAGHQAEEAFLLVAA